MRLSLGFFPMEIYALTSLFGVPFFGWVGLTSKLDPPSTCLPIKHREKFCQWFLTPEKTKVCGFVSKQKEIHKKSLKITK